MTSEPSSSNKSVPETPSQRAFRLTPQRREVYEALQGKRDHPTAVDVFTRVKEKIPGISLATVYSCLERLAESGLVRAVHHDRQPSRYCANLAPHAHFFCQSCGAVHDVPGHEQPTGGWQLPPGAVLTQHEVSFRGYCGACAPAHLSPSPARTSLS